MQSGGSINISYTKWKILKGRANDGRKMCTTQTGTHLHSEAKQFIRNSEDTNKDFFLKITLITNRHNASTYVEKTSQLFDINTRAQLIII